ncbi:septum formation initiator family protein [Niameybacter massiliensis]|uniref:Septum formation initiator family protein n=1 Tax=Holtiella tumoricola TaxID=3018743 RepID=A0AA42DPK2_9FIRM|nr:MULTISPECIES: septum formation initiator family protein [Lachnospirales]MDA3732775.1 septum formation initiator family protein [Holtiella tumoricola]
MINKKIIWRITFITSMGILLYLGARTIELNKVINKLDNQLVEATKKLEEEQNELEELNKEKDNMETLEYIERVARDKLGMVKKDDIVFKEK